MSEKIEELTEQLSIIAQNLITEFENLEDYAPTDSRCAICTLGTGRHVGYCGYHMAKYIEGNMLS